MSVAINSTRNPGEDRNLLLLDPSCDVGWFGKMLTLGKQGKGHMILELLSNYLLELHQNLQFFINIYLNKP